MKVIFISFILTIMLFCCPLAKALDNLTADDIKFLKSCNIEQSDIDVIPKLPSDGKEKIEMVLESSKKNCNMPIVREFKATREFLKKLLLLRKVFPCRRQITIVIFSPRKNRLH